MTQTILKRTPWGKLQSHEDIGAGVIFYSTASHGGYKVPAKLNKLIPDLFRCDDGWYEEDCAWSIVHVFLNEHIEFVADKYLQALETVKCWYPHEWQEYNGAERGYSAKCQDCNHDTKTYCLKRASTLAKPGDIVLTASKPIEPLSANPQLPEYLIDTYFILGGTAFHEQIDHNLVSEHIKSYMPILEQDVQDRIDDAVDDLTDELKSIESEKEDLESDLEEAKDQLHEAQNLVKPLTGRAPQLIGFLEHLLEPENWNESWSHMVNRENIEKLIEVLEEI
jgi:hypothetical protein